MKTIHFVSCNRSGILQILRFWSENNQDLAKFVEWLTTLRSQSLNVLRSRTNTLTLSDLNFLKICFLVNDGKIILLTIRKLQTNFGIFDIWIIYDPSGSKGLNNIFWKVTLN